MKNIIYTRVSTVKQKEKGHSLQFQKDELLKYCTEHNILNPIVYSDQGYSGKNFNRPKIKKVIELIKKNKVRRLIFLKIDRISRTTVDFINLIDLCREYDTELVCTYEQIDLSASGEFMATLKSLLGQLERKQISERTKDGIVGGLAKGIWSFGGTLPLGISRNKETKKIYYNSERFIVLRIFDLDGQGYSNVKIAKIIKENYEINCTQNRIKSVLQNTIYQGYVTYRGKYYNLIEPLIRDNKNIEVDNDSTEVFKDNDKEILEKIGYINLITPYKYYFSSHKDSSRNHVYKNSVPLKDYYEKYLIDFNYTIKIREVIYSFEKLIKSRLSNLISKEYNNENSTNLNKILKTKLEEVKKQNEGKLKAIGNQESEYFKKLKSKNMFYIELIEKLAKDSSYHYVLINDFNLKDIKTILDIFPENKRSSYDELQFFYLNSNPIRILRNKLSHGNTIQYYVNSLEDNYFDRCLQVIKRMKKYILPKLIDLDIETLDNLLANSRTNYKKNQNT